jgi:hypothetical protein
MRLAPHQGFWREKHDNPNLMKAFLDDNKTITIDKLKEIEKLIQYLRGLEIA